MRKWLLTAAMVLAVPMVMADTCGGSGGTAAGSNNNVAALPSPPNCPAPAIAPSLAPQTAPEPPAPKSIVEATIPINAAPSELSVGFGSIWTVAHRTNTLFRIDPTSNQVIASVQLDSPGGFGAVTIGSRYVWLGVDEHLESPPSPNQLWRIDPTTSAVDRKFLISSVADAAEVDGALWVDIDVQWGPAVRDAVEQIDPDTGKVLKSVDLGPARSGLKYFPPTLRYGLGSLWVSIANDEIARVDPVAPKVIATIRTPSIPAGYPMLAFMDGHAFIAMHDFTLGRIDPATNCVDAIVFFGANLPRSPNPFAGPLGLTPAPQGLYVGFDRGALARLDPGSMTIVISVRVDEQDYTMGSIYAFGSIWFTSFGNDTILRLKPI